MARRQTSPWPVGTTSTTPKVLNHKASASDQRGVSLDGGLWLTQVGQIQE